jgi:hypothetical protein
VPFRSALPHRRRNGPAHGSGAAQPRGLEALQRSAGNQAVGAILARLRSEERAAKPQASLMLDSLGPIALESVEAQGKGTRSFAITFRGHSATAALAAAYRNARVFETGTLVFGGTTYELKAVTISSLNVDGDVLTLELDASAAYPKRPAEEDKKEEPAPRFEVPRG